MANEPGWYPDPWQPARRRWWDGTSWGDHTWDPNEPNSRTAAAADAAAAAGVLDAATRSLARPGRRAQGGRVGEAGLHRAVHRQGGERAHLRWWSSTRSSTTSGVRPTPARPTRRRRTDGRSSTCRCRSCSCSDSSASSSGRTRPQPSRRSSTIPRATAPHGRSSAGSCRSSTSGSPTSRCGTASRPATLSAGRSSGGGPSTSSVRSRGSSSS